MDWVNERLVTAVCMRDEGTDSALEKQGASFYLHEYVYVSM